MSNLCKEIELMLSGYLDGELTQQQSQGVHAHLEQCEQCNKLYADLLEMKSSIEIMEKPIMSEKEMHKIMADKPAKGLSYFGWVLLIVGVSFFVGVTAYQFLIEDSTSVWLKLIISSIYGGIAFLFLSVLRQRLVARKTDKYRGVDL
ncbi:anti-sigma factor family protein [Pleionea sediminis]|uniref:anti-sigma factor family protein n=1 Tax=Pleionea sediminis TaxID=2569479 RepID=UPI0011864E29|nr:zf-HC2 domain-containing protein [Pleionea sediminis]